MTEPIPDTWTTLTGDYDYRSADDGAIVCLPRGAREPDVALICQTLARYHGGAWEQVYPREWSRSTEGDVTARFERSA